MRQKSASTDGAASSRREHRKMSVRAAILRSSERLFRRRGFVATSMSDIADHAGVSRKTLFNYMASKESIVYAMIDAFVGQHMPGWLESDKPSYHDERDIVTPHVTERLNEIARNRWLLTLAAKHTRFFHADRTRLVDATLQRNLRARAKRIAAVQKEGHIRGDIPALSISFYYEALRDLTLSRWLLTPDSKTKDLQRSFVEAMSVLERGLAPTKKGTAKRRSVR
ncbi:MAG TPA: TetR/AcrR family transcriptional regulator [Steroidobacteraceae bacterium]|nr:TetR/AcrR family transcriptional regulator [Steroidobacteraceae bacterium]